MIPTAWHADADDRPVIGTTLVVPNAADHAAEILASKPSAETALHERWRDGLANRVRWARASNMRGFWCERKVGGQRR
jgi:hypothetical protein